MSAGSNALSRSAARLAAVQALYQIAEAGADTEPVIQEFITFRIGKELEGVSYPAADEPHFTSVVTGASSRRAELDALIAGALASGWSLGRLGKLMLAILHAATFELVGRPDVPVRVVINEYVELTRDFFDDKDVAFVNAALDRIAQQVRTGEMKGGAKTDETQGTG